MSLVRSGSSSLLLFILAASPASASGHDKCSASLLPQLSVEKRSREFNNAWLKLVNKEHFESIKKAAGIDSGASAALPIKGVPAEFSGFFNGSWEEFNKKRDAHLSLEQGYYSEATREGIFRQSLSAEQLAAWSLCIRGEGGLFVELSDDSKDSVTANVSVGGDPSSIIKVSMGLTNGTVDGKKDLEFELRGKGNRRFDVSRIRPANTKVIVTAGNSESALSLWPMPASPPPEVQQEAFVLSPTAELCSDPGNTDTVRCTWFEKQIVPQTPNSTVELNLVHLTSDIVVAPGPYPKDCVADVAKTDPWRRGRIFLECESKSKRLDSPVKIAKNLPKATHTYSGTTGCKANGTLPFTVRVVANPRGCSAMMLNGGTLTFRAK